MPSALEFRNESWLCPKVIGLCKAHQAALCMADRPPFLDDAPVTAGFVYLRRHGTEGNYQGEYTRGQLEQEAERIKAHLSHQRDVFIFFNNDAGAAAPRNALELAVMLPGHRGEKP